MRLEVGGKHYGGFNGASLAIRLDQLCNTFSFEAIDAKASGLPFVAGESCRVFVDGEQQASGYIEKVSVSGDAGSHSIKIEGRDRTADLVDGVIGSLSDFKAPISLSVIIKAVISHLGADIRVVDYAQPEPFNVAEDIAAPEPGDNAFAFLEALARKRQVILGSDGLGRVAIFSGKGRRTGGAILHRRDDVENNVLSYSVGYDHTGRFGRYLVLGQPNPAVGASFLGADTTVANVKPAAVATDTGARVGRQYVIAGESATSEGESIKRATWEAKIRRARAATYSATVHGYRDQKGDLWTVNTAPAVEDDYAGISGRMLINSVAFTMSARGQGRTTNLGFIEEGAYVLSMTESPGTKKGKGVAWEGLESYVKKAKNAVNEAVGSTLEDTSPTLGDDVEGEW